MLPRGSRITTAALQRCGRNWCLTFLPPFDVAAPYCVSGAGVSLRSMAQLTLQT